MNTCTVKRIIALCAALILIPATTLAASFDLYELLSGDPAVPVRITLSEPKILSLSYFDSKRTEQINRLLKHLSLEITQDGSRSSTVFRVDDEDVFSVLSAEEQETVLTVYSFDPGIVYKQRKNGEEAGEGLIGFLGKTFNRINGLADSMYPLFLSLPARFEGFSRSEEVSINLSGYGKAAVRVTISFSADYVGERFPAEIQELAEEPDCREFLEGLVFSGPQKVILLYDQDQRLIRVSYNGQVGSSAETLRNVSLVWKCSHTEGETRDHFQLKTPSVKGYDRNNFTCSRELSLSNPEHQSLSWDIQIDEKEGQERRQTRFSAEWASSEGRVTGKAEYTVREHNETKRTTVIPALQKEITGEYTGTLEIADYSGKIVKNSFAVHVDIGQGETVASVPVETATIVDPETGTGKAPGDPPEQRLNQIVIRGILKIPTEDLAFLSDGLPEDIWSDIIQ